jgi:hypothetical protein
MYRTNSYEDVNLNQSSLKIFHIENFDAKTFIDVKFWSVVEKMFNFFAIV